MRRERYYNGIEDDKYDEGRQREVDAGIEGREAGRRGDSIEMDPYMGIGAESRAWRAGRLETLGSSERRAA